MADSRVMIFIDFSNVFLYVKNCLGKKVDALKLAKLLSTGRNIAQVHYFSSEDPSNPKQKRYHDYLERSGILVHTYPLVERPAKIYCPTCHSEVKPYCENCNLPVELPPHKSKTIDIDLATTIQYTAPQYDEAMIVSGDQDFIPVIRYIRSQLGKRVTIAAFKKTLSYVLERNCNEKIELDDKISEFCL